MSYGIVLSEFWSTKNCVWILTKTWFCWTEVKEGKALKKFVSFDRRSKWHDALLIFEGMILHRWYYYLSHTLYDRWLMLLGWFTLQLVHVFGVSSWCNVNSFVQVYTAVLFVIFMTVRLPHKSYNERWAVSYR